MNRFKFLAVCATVIAAGTLARAEELVVTFPELIAGSKLQASIVPADLTDAFKAWKIQAPGGGLGDMSNPFAAMFGVMGSLFAGQDEEMDQAAPFMELAGLLDVSWSKGDVAVVEGKRYLVTYKLGGRPTREKGALLVLTLVGTEHISSLTAMLEMTKETFIQTLNRPLPKPPMGGDEDPDDPR